MGTHVTGNCPHCNANYRLRAYAVGRRARCRTCKQVFVVPGEPKDAGVEDDVVSWLGPELNEEGGGDTDDDEEEDEESDAPPVPGLGRPEAEGHHAGSQPV